MKDKKRRREDKNKGEELNTESKARRRFSDIE
jgi:hypothetical protein